MAPGARSVAAEPTDSGASESCAVELVPLVAGFGAEPCCDHAQDATKNSNRMAGNWHCRSLCCSVQCEKKRRGCLRESTSKEIPSNSGLSSGAQQSPHGRKIRRQ